MKTAFIVVGICLLVFHFGSFASAEDSDGMPTVDDESFIFLPAIRNETIVKKEEPVADSSGNVDEEDGLLPILPPTLRSSELPAMKISKQAAESISGYESLLMDKIGSKNESAEEAGIEKVQMVLQPFAARPSDSGIDESGHSSVPDEVRFFILPASRNLSSWSGAAAACEARGARLAIVRNKEEHELIRKLVAGTATGKVSRAWFGLFRDGACSSGWRWVDQACLKRGDFTGWGMRQPDNHNNGENYADYLLLTERDLNIQWEWNDDHVVGWGRPAMAICEIYNYSPMGPCRGASNPTQTPERLPDNGRFFVIHKNVPFERAGEICQAHGARLAVLKTQKDNEYVRNMLKAITSDQWKGFWIGLFRDNKSCPSGWRWADETCLRTTDKTFWHSDEPNNVGEKGEDASNLVKELGYKWNDAFSGNTNFPLCESLKLLV